MFQTLSGLLIVALLTSSPAATRFTGTWPTPVPRVSVDTREDVAEALRAVARESGVGLVLLAPKARLHRSLDLAVKDSPVTDVLEHILVAGDLSAKLENGALIVTKAGADDDDGVAVEVAAEVELDSHDKVQIGQDITVPAGESTRDVVAVGGSVFIDGTVEKDAVAVAGNLVVRSTGVIRGDAVAVGGRVTVEPGGKILGDRVALAGPIEGVVDGLVDFGRQNSGVFRVLGLALTVLWVLTLFGLGFVTTAMVPERVAGVGRTIKTRPLASVFAGLGTVILLPPVCIVLIISIVGIIAVPFVVLAFLALLLVGAAGFAFALGEVLGVRLGKTGPMWAYTLGAGVLMLLYVLPWVGGLVALIIAVVGAGATVVSRFGGASPHATIAA